MSLLLITNSAPGPPSPALPRSEDCYEWNVPTPAERAGMPRPPQAGQRFDAPLRPAQTDSAGAPLGVGLRAAGDALRRRQTLQVRRTEVYTIPTVLPTNTESKGARTHSHALTGKRLAHTCTHALQWRAHRDPPSPPGGRPGASSLSWAYRPKAAGPEVLDTEYTASASRRGAPQFLSDPAQPLPLWPGFRGPRPPGKSCPRGCWGPGFSGVQ